MIWCVWWKRREEILEETLYYLPPIFTHLSISLLSSSLFFFNQTPFNFYIISNLPTYFYSTVSKSMFNSQLIEKPKKKFQLIPNSYSIRIKSIII